MTPRPHAALIKAWADGAVVQSKNIQGNWVDSTNPLWSEHMEYRIKPEPKPDRVRKFYFYGNSGGDGGQWFDGYMGGNTIECIFDGETGKLKAVEISK